MRKNQCHRELILGNILHADLSYPLFVVVVLFFLVCVVVYTCFYFN